jgi:ABC-2 type transport system permease protein
VTFRDGGHRNAMHVDAHPLVHHSAAPRGPDDRLAWGDRLRLLAVQVEVELRITARSIEFVIIAVALPTLLFAMFGLPEADPRNVLPDGTRVSTMLLVSLCAYGVVSLALFTFGEQLARERGRGWTRTMHATPLPVWSHLAAKVIVALCSASLIVASTGCLAVAAGNVRLDPLTWLRLTVTLLAGVLAFASLGFAVAYATRPRTATATANLLFLPLSFLSGFFVPLAELPAVLGTLAVWLPTYHFGQLAWRQVASPAGVEAWVGIAPAAMWGHLAWVLGATLVFGAVALVAARREGVSRRG